MAGIRLNSNILSLNAQRRLGKASSSLNESFSKLSSGLRITKPADDAAGLAISESLKTDARLSSQALRNVNDGISMISIINGALDAQKGILYRMAELAEQSANGVLSAKQREPLQNEYRALQEEFDRIASSATFNDISLLRNPDPNTISLMAGITGADSSLLEVAAANSHRFAGKVAMKSDLNDDGVVDINDLNDFIVPSLSFNYSTTENLDIPYFQDFSEFILEDSNGNDVTVHLTINRFGNDFGSSAPDIYDSPVNISLFGSAILESGEEVSISTTIPTSDIGTINQGITFAVAGTTAVFTIDLSDFEFDTVTPFNTNIRTSNIGFTNVTNTSAARRSVNTVSNRIEDLSILQGQFGALESRLQVAASKLAIDRENFLSAASQITDLDVANESSKLISNQILTQASTAILAQANQQPEIALRLLSDI